MKEKFGFFYQAPDRKTNAHKKLDRSLLKSVFFRTDYMVASLGVEASSVEFVNEIVSGPVELVAPLELLFWDEYILVYRESLTFDPDLTALFNLAAVIEDQIAWQLIVFNKSACYSHTVDLKDDLL